jgi:putative ABC transport system substrate-binding protein
MPLAANDPEGRARVAAFQQELQRLGWTDGRNVRIDILWSADNSSDARKYAAELVARASEVILAVGSPATGALLEATRNVPIVFVNVVDPVGGGFVDNLSRPGGNATGFTLAEYSTSGKGLELLKEISPHMTRAAILRDPSVASGSGQLGAIQSVAPSFGVELIPVGVRDVDEIEHAITTFARAPNGGMIVTASALAVNHRDLIIRLAARHSLPTIYPQRLFVLDGGLISYAADFIDQFRRAASYVDRILRGERPGDLPVQAPTKYELAINLKTAKALGLEVPHSLLARADEVIE